MYICFPFQSFKVHTSSSAAIMSQFSKQHLIFMPEKGKSNLKLTTDLKVQEKHETDSCEVCQSRRKNWFVNVQSAEVQRSILKQQRDCLKVWNETMDNISEGNVSGKKTAGNLNDVIVCVDDFEDSDVEVISSPTLLPNLSPITNSKPKTPSTNITSINSTLMVNPSTLNLSLNCVRNGWSTPSKSTLISKTQTPTDDYLRSLYALLKSAKFDTATRNLLTYSHRDMSDDHVFWIRKQRKVKLKTDRHELMQLKAEIKKAKVDGLSDENPFLKNLQNEISQKEEEFASRHISRICLEEYHGRCEPMSPPERSAVYHLERGQYYKEFTNKQKNALKFVRQNKSLVKDLNERDNKFAPLLANELYYKERMYRKKYLKLKTSDLKIDNLVSLDQNLNIQEPSLVTKKKKNKHYLREKLKQKRIEKKAARLKKFLNRNNNELAETPSKTDNLLNKIIHTSELVTKVSETVPSQNSDCLYHVKTPSLPSRSTKEFQATPRKKISNQETPSSQHDLSTPTRSLKHPKFRPYKSLLGFTSM